MNKFRVACKGEGSAGWLCRDVLRKRLEAVWLGSLPVRAIPAVSEGKSSIKLCSPGLEELSKAYYHSFQRMTATLKQAFGGFDFLFLCVWFLFLGTQYFATSF